MLAKVALNQLSADELSPIVAGRSLEKSLEYFGKLLGTLEATGQRNLDDRFIGGPQ
jgi:hypothetical protein